MDPRQSAFIEDMSVPGAPEGPLKGLTFAVKDMFDVEGYLTGFGNPTWRETHPVATSTAPPVKALLAAGASVKGKTHMDELAYSLNGENLHYGTPRNPRCPDRIPGGSSSGSVVAVADGATDFAIGSDTGGSVRVPSSYCGVFGIRPSHGRISLDLAAPLAPSYDTVGWFARTPELLRRVGGVLLPASNAKTTTFKRWLVAPECMNLASKATSDLIYQAFAKNKAEIEALLSKPTEVKLAGEGETLSDWRKTFFTVQASEAWQAQGDWIKSTKPTLGPGIKDRFEMGSQFTAEQLAEARAKREVITAKMAEVLGDDGVLTIPTTPGPAPLLNMEYKALEDYRSNALQLTCIAGNSRLPQVNLPFGEVEGCPVGLSIIGPRGSDEALLELAEKLYPLVKC